MITTLLAAQLAATAYAGLELTTVNSTEHDDLQHAMYGGAYIWVDGPLFWLEGKVSAKRWGGHDALKPGSPFNLEAGRVLELVWAGRTGVHIADCRLGVRFGRRAVNWLTDDRRGWGPEGALPSSEPLPRLGYHAEITPYADCPLGPLVLRGWGPVLVKQGNTLPRANFVLEPAIVFGNAELQARLEWGQQSKFIADFRAVFHPHSAIALAIGGGETAHPGWGPPIQRIFGALYITAGAFHTRQRTIGYY